MLHDLLNKLSGREAAERKAMEDRYVELLLSADHGDDSVTELRDVMTKLGKTAADAAKDAQTLTQAQRLQKTIINGSGLRTKMDQASRAANEFGRETHALMAQRQEKQHELSNAYHSLTENFNEGQKAEQRLKELVASNPITLRTLTIPTWTD